MILKEYKIGDFLKRIRRNILLDNNQRYKLVTIKMNHKGVVLRENKLANEIKSNMYQVKEGDFILSGIDARNGAFGIVPKELEGAIVTNDFWYFEIDELIIDKHFFLYLTSTNWFDEICNRASDGTTERVRLKKDKFFDQKIKLPALNDQKVLLAKFQVYNKRQKDFLIENTTQKILIKQLKYSILQDAIEGRLTEFWRKENETVENGENLLAKILKEKEKLIKDKTIKKEKKLAPFKSDEISFELPKSWVWCRLADLCSKTGSGSTPTGGKTSYLSEGIKFLRSQNIYDIGLQLDGITFISENVHERMKGSKVLPNDLLLNITGGSIGRCAIVSALFENGNINQHVAIIRPVFFEIGFYLHKVIISNYFQKEIIKAQTGAGREGLPKNKMDEILIPLPPLDEQKIIIDRVESLMKSYDALEKEILESEKQANNLLQAVLKEAFEAKEEVIIN